MGLKTIELNDEEKKYVKVYVDKCHISQVAFTAASVMVKKANEELWEALFKLYPEVDGSLHSLTPKMPTFSHDLMVIRYFEKNKDND